MQTLKELEADSIPMITALNKIDRIPNAESICREFPEFDGSALISALNKKGLDQLLLRISEELFETNIPISVSIPYKEGHLISMFHEFGQVEKINHGVEKVNITGRIPARLLGDLKRYQTGRQ